MNTYKMRECPICSKGFVSTDKYCPKCGINTEEPFKIIHYPSGSNSIDSHSVECDSYSIEWDTSSDEIL